MRTADQITGLEPLEHDEEEAVRRLLTDGTPIPSAVAQRIEVRARKITEEISRTHGVIDDAMWQKIIGDDDESLMPPSRPDRWEPRVLKRRTS